MDFTNYSGADKFVYALVLSIIFFIVSSGVISKKIDVASAIGTQNSMMFGYSLIFFVLVFAVLLLYNSTQNTEDKVGIWMLAKRAIYATMLFYIVSSNDIKGVLFGKLTETGVDISKNSDAILAATYFVVQFLLTL